MIMHRDVMNRLPEKAAGPLRRERRNSRAVERVQERHRRHGRQTTVREATLKRRCPSRTAVSSRVKARGTRGSRRVAKNHSRGFPWMSTLS
jgi:hypothetical protein